MNVCNKFFLAIALAALSPSLAMPMSHTFDLVDNDEQASTKKQKSQEEPEPLVLEKFFEQFSKMRNKKFTDEQYHYVLITTYVEYLLEQYACGLLHNKNVDNTKQKLEAIKNRQMRSMIILKVKGLVMSMNLNKDMDIDQEKELLVDDAIKNLNRLIVILKYDL